MTDQPTKPLMTPTKAAARLEDILKWKLEIQAIEPSIRSTPTDTDGIRTSRNERLPFGLNPDTTASDGARGCTTSHGADTWLEMWAAWMSWLLDTPLTGNPGPWLYKQLTENHALNDVRDWEGKPRQEWELFTKELSRLHRRVANLTGHALKMRGICPTCREGALTSEPGPTGFDDKAQCTNPHCRTIINYAEVETLASFRSVLTDPDLPETWVTLSQVRAVWPTLRENTLHKWVQRGHVTKQEGLYNLASINRWQATKHAAPTTTKP